MLRSSASRGVGENARCGRSSLREFDKVDEVRLGSSSRCVADDDAKVRQRLSCRPVEKKMIK